MASVALSVVLVIAALALVVSHLRAWRSADHGGLGEREREFHARRFRRRVQASVMVGVIGLLLLGDLWLRTGWPALLYWSGVLLLLLWLLLLAASDWLASRVHFHQQLSRLQGERALLQADLDRLRDRHRRSTGTSPTDTDEP
ncbi:hypothetical protein ETAA8_49670 [Anatilimnocola aggregata]|uniref:Transmembrane protein n=1 Tax=Anatilimnocola aggregata TaxID=2528021 RepID=A0A517YI14_9BACT|nr:hypothetical protein [Anatilimnocola aggregata]QDU29851.1 hypothetical protein ETAA8_49670 [Anatilimnocola aggregata]